MNETLSTLIAFVGVLIVFSMLLQSVQEAFKNLIKLKAGVWESFLRALYASEFGLQTKRTCGEKIRDMWQRSPVGPFESRLLKLRSVLEKSTDLMRTAQSQLQALMKAGQVPAEESAKKQALYDTLRALKDLGLVDYFKVYNQQDPDKLGDLKTALESVLKATGESPSEISDKLSTQLTTAQERLSDYRGLLEQRYESFAAEVNNTYRRHMLWVTIALGLIFVGCFNADAFSIYRQLSNEPKARAAATTYAHDVTKQTISSKAEVLNDIHTFIHDKNLEQAKTTSIKFCESLTNDFNAFKDKVNADKATAVCKTTGDSAGDLTDQESTLASLFVDLNRTAVESLARDVNALDLPLGWSVQKFEALSHVGAWVNKVLGLLLTLFLITFGAPFWNDVLNALIGMKKTLGNP